MQRVVRNRIKTSGCNWVFFERGNLVSSLSACPILGAKNIGVRRNDEFINHMAVADHEALCVRSLRGRLFRRRVVSGAMRENYGGKPCLRVY
jgi:hypothetical protein